VGITWDNDPLPKPPLATAPVVDALSAEQKAQIEDDVRAAQYRGAASVLSGTSNFFEHGLAAAQAARQETRI
jgi:hypothetical protein